MMHANAVHSKDVSLACVVACYAIGVIIARSVCLRFEVVPKFI